MYFNFPIIVHIWLALSLISGLYWIFLTVNAIKALRAASSYLHVASEESELDDLSPIERHKLFNYASNGYSKATTVETLSFLVLSLLFGLYMFFSPPDPIAPLTGLAIFAWVFAKVELIALYRKRRDSIEKKI